VLCTAELSYNAIVQQTMAGPWGMGRPDDCALRMISDLALLSKGRLLAIAALSWLWHMSVLLLPVPFLSTCPH
jgi:hypothetical protein